MQKHERIRRRRRRRKNIVHMNSMQWSCAVTSKRIEACYIRGDYWTYAYVRNRERKKTISAENERMECYVHSAILVAIQWTIWLAVHDLYLCIAFIFFFHSTHTSVEIMKWFTLHGIQLKFSQQTQQPAQHVLYIYSNIFHVSLARTATFRWTENLKISLSLLR